MSVNTPDSFPLPGRLSFTTRSEVTASAYKNMGNAANHLWARWAANRLGGVVFDEPLTTFSSTFTTGGLKSGNATAATLTLTDQKPIGVADRAVGSNRSKARLRFFIYGKNCELKFTVVRVNKINDSGGILRESQVTSFTVDRSSASLGWSDAIIEIDLSESESGRHLRIDPEWRTTASTGTLLCYFVSEDPFPGHAASDSPGVPDEPEPLPDPEPDPEPGFTDPTDIADLELWVDVDNLALSHGADVTAWNDQSGNARHFSQYLTRDYPIYDAFEDAVVFDYAQRQALESAFSLNATSWSVWIGVNRNNQWDGAQLMYLGQGAASDQRTFIDILNEGQIRYWNTPYNSVVGGTTLDSNAQVATDGYDLWTFQYDEVNNYLTIHKNGNLQRWITVDDQSTHIGDVILGSTLVVLNDGSFNLKGLLVYSDYLSSQDFSNIKDYCDTNWSTGTGIVEAEPAPEPEPEPEPDPEPEPEPDPDPTGTEFLNRTDTRMFYSNLATNPGGAGSGGTYLDEFLNNTGGWRDDYITFLKAPHGRSDYSVNRLLLVAHNYYTHEGSGEDGPRRTDAWPIQENGLTGTNEAKMRNAITELHNNGIAVEFLIPSGTEALTTTARQNLLISHAKSAIDYNRRCTARSQMFDGIHWNIEWWRGPSAVDRNNPYDTGGYGVPYSATIVQRHKNVCNAVRSEINKFKNESGGFYMTQAYFVGGDLYYFMYGMNTYWASSAIDYLAVANYFDARPDPWSNKNTFVYGWTSIWDSVASSWPYTESYRHTSGSGWPGQYTIIVGAEASKRMYADFNIPVAYIAETIEPGSAEDFRSFWLDTSAGQGDTRYDGYNNLFDSFDTFKSRHLGGNVFGIGYHYGGWPNDNSFHDLDAGS